MNELFVITIYNLTASTDTLKLDVNRHLEIGGTQTYILLKYKQIL